MKLKQILVSIIAFGTILGSTTVSAKMPESGKAEQVEQMQSAVVSSDKVNINTATADELKRVLVGIGQKKAEAIVQYREKHGLFTAPEQLLEVQGFGKATLEKNKDRILF
ncbi:competence protein ComEA [Cricetibacter osteomyelitidis]|uniref:Competence protein ComEA n=1 Tax=Cricetibacter osteomyelitidis TaxID=1521931 RepID=A0A4R2SRM3_9PAST|nr:helix-hairpin-helix domain-containing protein [Cricetibacter osteomyelitidis]TCP91261.1 competence protein ComEA [Cricetibacter osteomyelitidis]